MDEFKKFRIPVKWRKYIWVGVIGGLIFAMKWLAAWIIRLNRELKECNQEKVEILKTRTKSDSLIIREYMQRAFEKADKEVIQPKIDSIKADKL